MNPILISMKPGNIIRFSGFTLLAVGAFTCGQLLLGKSREGLAGKSCSADSAGPTVKAGALLPPNRHEISPQVAVATAPVESAAPELSSARADAPAENERPIRPRFVEEGRELDGTTSLSRLIASATVAEEEGLTLGHRDWLAELRDDQEKILDGISRQILPGIEGADRRFGQAALEKAGKSALPAVVGK